MYEIYHGGRPMICTVLLRTYVIHDAALSPLDLAAQPKICKIQCILELSLTRVLLFTWTKGVHEENHHLLPNKVQLGSPDTVIDWSKIGHCQYH